MRLNRKILQLAVIPTLVWLGAGCAGFNASESISPASFFLPGLLQTDPQPPQQPNVIPAAEPQTRVFQA